MNRRERRRQQRLIRCPVCGSCAWDLYAVHLVRHRKNFLKSRLAAIQGPWGTCHICRNHFSLSTIVPRMLNKPGGFPVEEKALNQAKHNYTWGNRREPWDGTLGNG